MHKSRINDYFSWKSSHAVRVHSWWASCNSNVNISTNNLVGRIVNATQCYLCNENGYKAVKPWQTIHICYFVKGASLKRKNEQNSVCFPHFLRNPNYWWVIKFVLKMMNYVKLRFFLVTCELECYECTGCEDTDKDTTKTKCADDLKVCVTEGELNQMGNDSFVKFVRFQERVRVPIENALLRIIVWKRRIVMNAMKVYVITLLVLCTPKSHLFAR